MKALARSYNAPEEHFKSANVLVDLRGSSTAFVQSGTINNTVTIKTARTQQAYRIPFEITSWSWGGMISPIATSNVTIIGFN